MALIKKLQERHRCNDRTCGNDTCYVHAGGKHVHLDKNLLVRWAQAMVSIHYFLFIQLCICAAFLPVRRYRKATIRRPLSKSRLILTTSNPRVILLLSRLVSLGMLRVKHKTLEAFFKGLLLYSLLYSPTMLLVPQTTATNQSNQSRRTRSSKKSV